MLKIQKRLPVLTLTNDCLTITGKVVRWDDKSFVFYPLPTDNNPLPKTIVLDKDYQSTDGWRLDF